MAFCRYCGNQIADGATCPCQQQNTAGQQQAQPAQNVPQNNIYQGQQTQTGGNAAGQAAAMASAAGNAAKNAMGEFIPYIKSYIKAPKATVENAVIGGKFSIACGFFAINALAIIIALFSLLGSLASLANGFGSSVGVKVNLPVFRIIFGGILISAVIIVLAAVALLIFTKIGRSGLTFKNVLIAAAFHSFWPSVLVVGGCLIGLIGGIFGLFVAVMAVSFAIQMVTITAVSDARNLGGCDVTSTSGKMFLVPVILILTNFVISLVVGMLFSWCIGGITVNGYGMGGGLFSLLEELL